MTSPQSDFDSPHNPRRRSRKQKKQSPTPSLPEDDGMPPRTVTTSLDGVRILPRTPRTPRIGEQNRRGSDDVVAADEVELSLLGEDERREAALGLSEDRPSKRSLSTRDKNAMTLLIILCECICVSNYMFELTRDKDLIQGFPVSFNTAYLR